MGHQFGRLLKQSRKDAKLSQKQLLERIRQAGYEERYSEADISKWEHGRTKPPEDVIEDLEDVLFVSKGLLLAAAGYSAGKEYRKLQDQSALNLPPWVVQAQQAHLEGIERHEVFNGLETTTYPGGLGVRQRLEFFTGCFLEIEPRNQRFWALLSDHDIVMTQLRGHLRDEAFWKQVDDFREKDERCVPLLDAACKRFTSAGEELAPLRPSRGPEPGAYITTGWARRVLVRALTPEPGPKEPSEYHHQKLPDGGSMLEDDGLIYVGPDDVAAEQRHRELVDDFINTEEFNQIVSLMKGLRNLRQQIIARIDQCLRKREYTLNHCPDCPVEQARRLG